MLILGAVLLAVAVVLTAAAVTSNGTSVKFDWWGIYHSSMSVGTVFVAGMITTVVGVVGVLVLVAGMRRSRRLRKERKLAAKEAKEREQLTGGFDFSSSLPDFSTTNQFDTTDGTGKPKK